MYRITEREKRKIEGLDVAKEFALIKAKQCKHSVMVREIIVKQWSNDQEKAQKVEAKEKESVTKPELV